MAKQSGLVKISGAIDDLTFSATKNGHLVRKKGKVITKAEIANGKQYARMRENMDEFGRATEAGRLLRTAFNDSMAYCIDKSLITRSSTIMMEVLLSDPVSDRGERNVMNGDMKMLKDFLLNGRIRFGNICKREYSYWRKCSRFLCLSFTEMIMGSLVTFDSAGLYPVFETLSMKYKNQVFPPR